MEALTWRKDLFDSNYQLYSNGEIKGSLIFSSWKFNARGIALKNYYFTSEGLLNPITKIRDEHHNEVGVITYNGWKFKASIIFNNGQEPASWTFTNSWLTQWAITNHHNKQIYYNSSNTTGSIHTDNSDELLMLAGLFIREYYSRGTILFILAIVIPMIFRAC